MTIKRATALREKYWVGNYRHAMPYPKCNVYLRVRQHLQASQTYAAKLIGITPTQWRYRERSKRMYHVAELLCLHELSGLAPREFLNLLSECA